MQNKLILGLKGSTNTRQIVDRLSQKGISLYEFHLEDADLFGERFKQLEEWIRIMRRNGIQVMLHHPGNVNGTRLHINGTNSIMAAFYELSTRILVDLCEKYDCYTVIHWNYSMTGACIGHEVIDEDLPSEEHLRKTLEKCLAIDKAIGKGRIYWENGVMGSGAYRGDYVWAKMVAETDLKLTFDISHAFIAMKGDNAALQETMRLLDANIAYFHVVDSEGVFHDSLPIGKGKIAFQPLLPAIMKRPYIYEITLSDSNDCAEMLDSHRALQNIFLEQYS